MPVVNLPDGKRVNFPEGTPPEEMDRAIKQFLGEPEAQPTAEPDRPGVRIAGGLTEVPMGGTDKSDMAIAGGASPAMRQGMTFGLDDEMAGAAKAIGPFARTLWQGGDISSAWGAAKDAYTKGRQQVVDELQAYRAENPPGMVDIGGEKRSSAYPSLGSFGEEIAGGAISGGRIAPGMAATTTGGRMAQGGLAAGIEGTIYGGAAAEPGKRLQGAATGGLAGLALGMSVPAAVGAYRAIRGRFGGNPAERALDLLDLSLRADDVTPGRATTRLDTMGEGATVADIGGVKTRATVREAATKGMTANRYNAFLDRRQTNSAKRIIAAAKQSMDSPQGSLEAIDEMVRIRAANADAIYTQAYTKPIKSPENLNVLLKNNHMQGAWRKAADLINIDKDTAKAALTRAGLAGDEVAMARAESITRLPDLIVRGKDGVQRINPEAVKTTQVWDYVKRALDDEITSAMKADSFGRMKDSNLSRLLRRMKNEMLTEVDTQNPTFKLARSVFQGETEAIEAVNSGRRFLLGEQDMTLHQIRSLSPQEKELFRVGAADAIRQRLESGQITADAGKRIFGTADRQARLAAAFPNQRAYRDFQRTIISEARKTRVRRIVPTEAGSQTQPRQQGAAGQLGGAAVEAMTGSRLGAIRKLLGGDPGMSPEVADEILRLAGRPDAARETVNLLANLERQNRITPQMRATIEQALIGGGVAGTQDLNRP